MHDAGRLHTRGRRSPAPGRVAVRLGLRPVALGLVLLALGACASRAQTTGTGGGPLTTMGTDRYLQRAIRSSNEGVIMLPSVKAQRVYELPRLNEIAQGLREPAAACFLRRAIETMEAVDDERRFTDVPEGQVKIRARLAPSGEVVSTEVLETGFVDPHMPECVAQAIRRQSFPQNRGGVSHFVDIVYWVSLGLQSDVHTEAYRDQLRREQALAGVRGRPCLQRRVPPGHYQIDALNLVDRDGNTMVNRVDAPALGPEVRACLGQALRDLRLAPEGEAFVRPVVARIEVDVDNEGAVIVKDEQWLRLIELEDRARRDAQRAAAGLEVDGGDAGAIDPLGDEMGDDTIADGVGGDRLDLGAPPAEPAPSKPRSDPGTGGLKLDLGPRRP